MTRRNCLVVMFSGGLVAVLAVHAGNGSQLATSEATSTPIKGGLAFNLEVASGHSYLVSSRHLLAHNSSHTRLDMSDPPYGMARGGETLNTGECGSCLSVLVSDPEDKIIYGVHLVYPVDDVIHDFRIGNKHAP